MSGDKVRFLTTDMEKHEVDLTQTGLSITVQACRECGALTGITFEPGPEIDNHQKHTDWHNRLGMP